MPTTLIVDQLQTGPTIPGLLFGHNLEHTRSCIWHGLSAQLIRNRKLAGKPRACIGVPMEWYAIGSRSAFFALYGAQPFVRHYGADQRRQNEINCLTMQNTRRGGCGIGQEKVPLEGGREYEFRMVVRAPGKVVARVEVRDRAGTRLLARKAMPVGNRTWGKVAFTFRPSATDTEARLEITFSGAGRLDIGAVSLLPADHFHGMRRDVVERLKEIGVPILRWPGGNFAGDYRWQDGLLDVDERGPLQARMEGETLPHTLGFDNHEIGTDEYVALCREIGAEPFITLNIGWEDADLCAAWVEYCNGSKNTRWGKIRAQRGHPEPYNVRYWSLGNEMGYGHMEGPNDPAAYSKAVLPIIKAIRKVDPSIRIVVSGPEANLKWFSIAVKALAAHVDAFSHHYYGPWLKSFTDGTRKRGESASMAAAYERMMVTAPEQAFAGVARCRQLIDANVPKDKRLAISFDEWNTWYAWYRDPNIADGVFAAAFLNRLCREADLHGVSIGCYFEPVNEGAIVVEPFSARLTPIGQVMRHWKSHIGNVLVGLAMPRRNYLDVLASKNPLTGAVVVTLVNPSYNRDQTVRLRCASGPMHEGRIVLLYARDCLPGKCFTERVTAFKDSEAITVKIPRFCAAHVSFRA